MNRKILMDREHEQARRLRFLEILVILVVLTVLFGIALTQMSRYLDRGKLVEVFGDVTSKRTYIAERLSLTGELPDSIYHGVEYRFEHGASLASEVEASSLEIGFGAAQKAIEERLISKTSIPDKATQQTELATGSEALVSRQQYYDRPKDEEQQTTYGSKFTEGEDFFVSGGSFYYLIENLISAPEEGARIMSFVVNSPAPHDASTIWYSCGPSTATSLGSAATSEAIARIENHCR